MKSLFRVIAQSDPAPVSRQDGSQIQKSTIVLQELGGRYEDSYSATMLGNLALCKFYPDDIVWASLRFSAREYHPTNCGTADTTRVNYAMDVTVHDIVKMNHN